MTYGAWYSQYLQLYKRKLSPRTRESYDQVTRLYILPFLEGVQLVEVTPEHIQTAINAAADHGGRQAQIVFAVLHAVLRRAYRSRLIPWNPVDAIDKPEHEQEQGKALAAADLEAVEALIRDDLALSLALYAGLRRGEICGLQWADVDLKAGVLHVRRQRCRAYGRLIEKPPKSRAGVRDIPITGQLLPILRNAYCLTPHAWVVDVAPEAISRRWSRIQKQQGMGSHYRLHDLILIIF